MFFTVIWLIVWALNNFPNIFENPAWFVFLVIALFIDF